MKTNKRSSGGVSLFRGVLAGAALAIAGGSTLAAFSGDAAVWVAPLGVGAGVWSWIVAIFFAGLARHVACPCSRPVRRILLVVGLAIGLAALRDALGYYRLLDAGMIQSQRALPASLLVIGLIVWGGFLLVREVRPVGGRGWFGLAVGLPAGALAALLALLLTFAATDYRRPADCAVVLGAGVYANGEPSLSLSDRVAEGVRLYHQGLVPRLVMTGGIDPGHGHSEARVMARLAAEAGVPPEDILLDEAGTNTRASARSCSMLMQEEGLESALLVSHGYHLLRAKTAFQREGLHTYTVPATETRRLAREPYFVLRECAAWAYYALPWT